MNKVSQSAFNKRKKGIERYYLAVFIKSRIKKFIPTHRHLDTSLIPKIDAKILFS